MRRALVLTAAVLGACCTSTVPRRDVRVVTTVAPATVRAGGVVAVDVAVTNTAARPQTISVKTTCLRRFVVYDAAGTRLPDPPGLCTADAQLRALAPGETYVLAGRWGASVAPGTYTVRGWVASERGGEGPPATVTVTP